MATEMQQIEAMAQAYCRSIHVNPDKWDVQNGCPEWVNCMPQAVGLLKDYEIALARFNAEPVGELVHA